MSEKVICNICGQVVNIRKSSSMGAFPASHRREGHTDACHGFYIVSNNFPEKDDEKLCPHCGSTPYGVGCQNCPPCNR